MKKEVHPKEYRLVAFKDITIGYTFITRSTARSKETTTIDGVEYPLVKMEISSASHGFFTGQKKLIDSTGRVDKFRKRYGNIQNN